MCVILLSLLVHANLYTHVWLWCNFILPGTNRKAKRTTLYIFSRNLLFCLFVGFVFAFVCLFVCLVKKSQTCHLVNSCRFKPEQQNVPLSSFSSPPLYQRASQVSPFQATMPLTAWYSTSFCVSAFTSVGYRSQRVAAWSKNTCILKHNSYSQIPFQKESGSPPSLLQSMWLPRDRCGGELFASGGDSWISQLPCYET